MAEHDEQVALIAWVQYAKKRVPELDLLYAIPNGGMRDKAVAAKLKAEGVMAGVPDLHLPVARGEYHSLYIEMKFGKNILTDKQAELKPKLEKQGNAVVVCYSFEQAVETLNEYLVNHRLPQ